MIRSPNQAWRDPIPSISNWLLTSLTLILLNCTKYDQTAYSFDLVVKDIICLFTCLFVYKVVDIRCLFERCFLF